jgi:hypothetical protein
VREGLFLVWHGLGLGGRVLGGVGHVVKPRRRIDGVRSVWWRRAGSNCSSTLKADKL